MIDAFDRSPTYYLSTPSLVDFSRLPMPGRQAPCIWDLFDRSEIRVFQHPEVVERKEIL